MTSDEIKEFLAQPENYNCSTKNIKRGSKSKNANGQIVRVFSINKNNTEEYIEVVTNPEDSEIIYYSKQLNTLNQSEPVKTDNRKVKKRQLALVVRDLNGKIMNSSLGLDPELPNQAEDEFMCLCEEEFWITNLVVKWLYPGAPEGEYAIIPAETEDDVESLEIYNGRRHIANLTLERI